MERQTNAWTTRQGHDGSGLGEKMAVVAEGGPQGMYEAFDLQRTKTSFKN